MKILNHYSPEEYASFWGADPVYCNLPLYPGDGYLFYNFGSEKQERTIEWLLNFFDAIGRMIEVVNTRNQNNEDVQGLGELRDHVMTLIKNNGQPRPNLLH